MQEKMNEQACTCQVCNRLKELGVNSQQLIKELTHRDKGAVAESLMNVYFKFVQFIDPEVFNQETQYELSVVSDTAKAFGWGLQDQN